MSKNIVEITGINTSELKTLSDKEKIELFKKLKDGNKEAREKLAYGNLKLILSILKKYQNRCDNLDDLFQIGCIGLMKAIDNFDLKYNVKFSTYAVPLILGEIRRYLRDNNSNIRISRSVKDLAYKIIRTKDEYLINFGKEITNNELSKMLNVEEIDIINALQAIKDPISMSEPIYNDGGDTIYLEDQIESKKEKISNWDIIISFKDSLKKLKNKEKKIINDRFLLGKTQVEIANEIGISQAQVSRLEKESIKKLNKHFHN